VEKGLTLAAAADGPPQRLWLVASHIPDLKFLRQFAADLLGPGWREKACFTRVGAVLLRFDRQPQAVAAKTSAVSPSRPESDLPAQSDDTVSGSGPGPPVP
jgi:hypothetical protein